jgi:tRNA dimethylallyltransferase
MLAAGLLEEVRALFRRGDLSAEHPSMRAVGYRQLWRHLAGQCALEQAAQQAVAATRQLAKRQLTWLRRRNRALWFDSLEEHISQRVFHAIRERAGY